MGSPCGRQLEPDGDRGADRLRGADDVSRCASTPSRSKPARSRASEIARASSVVTSEQLRTRLWAGSSSAGSWSSSFTRSDPSIDAGSTVEMRAGSIDPEGVVSEQTACLDGTYALISRSSHAPAGNHEAGSTNRAISPPTSLARSRRTSRPSLRTSTSMYQGTGSRPPRDRSSSRRPVDTDLGPEEFDAFRRETLLEEAGHVLVRTLSQVAMPEPDQSPVGVDPLGEGSRLASATQRS